MRKGRHRKPGERYRCGKRTPQARTDEITQTAVEARMRVFGVSREIARSDAMGSPLGRLAHWRVITPAQADAGYDFAVTIRDYLATANLQRPTQGKAGFVPSQRSSSDSSEPVRGEMKARGYMEALAEIDRSDPFSAPTTISVLWDVCINEIDRRSDAEIGALRIGLNAIHRIMYGRRAA